jgi:hypothetical protein
MKISCMCTFKHFLDVKIIFKTFLKGIFLYFEPMSEIVFVSEKFENGRSEKKCYLFCL